MHKWAFIYIEKGDHSDLRFILCICSCRTCLIWFELQTIDGQIIYLCIGQFEIMIL